MAEYIDRLDTYFVLTEYYNHRTATQHMTLQEALEKVPIADVEPVVRSHWKKNDNGTYSCERCHSWIPEEQRYYANWCLYCGADMRGGDADGDEED